MLLRGGTSLLLTAAVLTLTSSLDHMTSATRARSAGDDVVAAVWEGSMLLICVMVDLMTCRALLSCVNGSDPTDE